MAGNASRAALACIPHLAVGDVVTRYDLGDEIAQRWGVGVVATACGQEVTSTLVTRRLDLVRCAACRTAATS